MPTEKDIICLANSIKSRPGRCVAGIDVDTGQWIRPVSERELGELRRVHYLTVEDHEPTPLDIIRIYLMEHDPKPLQPENWKVADQEWELISESPEPEHFEMLSRVLELGPDLLGNQDRAVPAGTSVDQSLALVKPENPVIWRRIREGDSDQTRLSFELGSVSYNFPITDPVWSSKVFDLLDSGERSLLNDHVSAGCTPLLTVSLGTEFKGKHWKLVAGIIPTPEEHF